MFPNFADLPRPHGSHVLLVAKEGSERERLLLLLHRAKLAVTTTPCALEAFALLEWDQFELVTALPDFTPFSGETFLTVIAERYPLKTRTLLWPQVSQCRETCGETPFPGL